MGFFSKTEPDTPDWLDNRVSEYKELLNDKECILGYVFEFYSNDGKEYIYKEVTKNRNVFLIRNKEKITLKQIDSDESVIFYKEIDCDLSTTAEKKIVSIIHQLYVESFDN